MVTLLDANGALLAAAMGLLLIFAEFCLPGWVIPGVSGGVCLLCGVYRLSMLDASLAAGAGLAALLLLAGAAGYGMLPEWMGWAAIAGVPWLCRLLVPGAIGWAAAVAAGTAPLAEFLLLRVAARAVLNKTLIH